MLELLHVLHTDVGIEGIFTDWPTTVTMYANCVILKRKDPKNEVYRATLGPRPKYLVDDMEASSLKTQLNTCWDNHAKGKDYYTPNDFSIGNRGACMQFPEHTEESYIAAMEMGAGIVECDVAVTKVLHMLFK